MKDKAWKLHNQNACFTIETRIQQVIQVIQAWNTVYNPMPKKQRTSVDVSLRLNEQSPILIPR